MRVPRDQLPPIPPETVHGAQAACPGGNVSMRMRAELGTLFDDEPFAAVYARAGQPALHPWRW
jgi:transposase